MKTTKIAKPKIDLQALTDLPKKGQSAEGKIIGATRFAVYVDLGPMGVGIIFGKEYYAANPNSTVK